MEGIISPSSMSKPEKHGPKKRPTKLNVTVSAKPSEFKRAAKLLEHKGLEFGAAESEQHDLFEAVALALGGSVSHGKALFARCLRRLQEWTAAGSFPKELEFLGEVRPFLDFYAAYPGHVLFEGVA